MTNYKQIIENNRTMIEEHKDAQEKIENLITLSNAIEEGKLNEIIKPRRWGGANVIIITQDNETYDIENHSYDDFFVVSENALILGGYFIYIKNKVMVGRDFHLYGLMALLAKDFIKNNRDNKEDYLSLLTHITHGVNEYYHLTNFMDYPERDDTYNLARSLLSDKTTNEEIKLLI